MHMLQDLQLLPAFTRRAFDRIELNFAHWDLQTSFTKYLVDIFPIGAQPAYAAGL